MALKFIFLTMSFLSYSSMLLSFKVSNDSYVIYSLLPTLNSDYIYFDIMTPNSFLFHCKLIMTNNPPRIIPGINPMSLGALGGPWANKYI